MEDSAGVDTESLIFFAIALAIWFGAGHSSQESQPMTGLIELWHQ
jgi:hypothetical protein